MKADATKLYDTTNVNAALELATTTSAVNWLKVVNSATGGAVEQQAQGADANIDLKLTPKGSGKVSLTGGLAVTGGLTFSGALKGNTSPVTFGRFTKALSDANYTLLNTEYVNRHLEFTGALTAGRNIVLPLVDGAEFVVTNSTTGGFALTFIGATGTGIAVAAGKTATLRSDGTNYLRVSPDV